MQVERRWGPWVLASANPHKAAELQHLLSVYSITIKNLADFPPMAEVEETGTSLSENAYLKASAVHLHTGLPSIADDTGLEVDALGGRPGVYTARYAGEKAGPADNMALLLKELEGIPLGKRTARFRTVVCLYGFAEGPIYAEGVVEGHIANEPAGSHGFGYDPLFVPDDGGGLRFAEMTDEQKHACSHRSRAIKQLVQALERFKTDQSSGV